MNATLELIFVLLSILGCLILGQVMRENNFRIIQEKFFALIAGVAIGLATRFFSMPVLVWFPDYCQVLLYFFLIEKVYTLPRALIFSRIGTILLLTAFAGGLSLAVGSFFLDFVLNNLKLQLEILPVIQLICVFLVPGGCFGVEKDLEYQIFINSQIFSLLFVYPFASLLPEGPANLFKGWTVGSVLGIVLGILGSVLLKYIKISKSWNSLEIFSTGIISLLAALASKPIGGCPIVSLIISSIILSKYTHISDISLITRNNLFISISGLLEILTQIWLGIQIVNIKLEYQYFTLLVLMVIILFISYAVTLAIAYLCKLKNIKFFDGLNYIICGVKGVGSVSVLVLLPEKIQSIAIFGVVVLNFIGMAFGYFVSSGKDESSYLISSNPCSKLKGYLQNFEETYLLPVFVKENAEKSILSPKFNENSQRFDAGIQMRPEIRDETSRELQALNLNMTETEMQGVLQLK